MKKQIIKYLIILVTFIAIFILSENKVQAATASISEDQTVQQGQTVTVTATVNAGAWNLTLSGGGQSAKLVGETDIVGNQSASTSITFIANEDTTVTLTGDITDFNSTSNQSEAVNKSMHVTVQKTSNNENNGGNNSGGNNETTPPSGGTTDPNSGTSNQNSGSSNPTGGTSNSNGGSSGSTNSNPNTTQTKSNVTTLSNLGITPNDFTGFKQWVKEYTVTVPNDVETIQVYANKGQSGQTITGTGTKTLQEGENRFEVTVTAEDGKTTATYVVTVNREAKEEEEEEPSEDLEVPEEFGLTKLEIEGITLEPEFSTNVYEYTAKLTENKDSVEITPEASEENAKIEITGNENLQNGENIITILVTNEAGDKTAAYQITLNKNVVDEEAIAAEQNIEKLQKQRTTILIGGIAILIILIIIAVIIIRNRRRGYVDDYSVPYSNLNDDENDDSYVDNYNDDNKFNYDNNSYNYDDNYDNNDNSQNSEVDSKYNSTNNKDFQGQGYEKISDKFKQDPYKNTINDDDLDINYDENQDMGYENNNYESENKKHKKGKRYR